MNHAVNTARTAGGHRRLVVPLASVSVALLAWLAAAALAPSPAGGQATDTQVRMVDFAFEPVEITVPLGSTVTWVYDDGQCDALPICEGHDTRAEVNGPDGEPLWDSEVFKGEGKTFTTTMTQVGTIPYICTVHQSALADMDGVVNVVAADESPTTTTSATPTPTTPTPTTPTTPPAAASVSGAAGPELPNTGPGPVPPAVGFGLVLAASATAWIAGARRARGR